MDIYKILKPAGKNKLKTIILPESYDSRVIKAAKAILKRGLAKLVLINTGKPVTIPGHKNLDIIDISFSAQFADEYLKIRREKNPGYTIAKAGKDLFDPLVFSCMLLRNNMADGVVAGSVYNTGTVIRNALQIIGLKKGNKTVSSFFLFNFPAGSLHKNKILAYADCGVLPNPSSAQLSDIALETCANFRKLTGIKPRAAFLSFSTRGSAKDASIDKITGAYRLTRKRSPALICDGELQFDAAFVPGVARRKNPGGKIKGDANVFIFPDLNSGNIAYKITERIGGATATGPIVQGLAKPVMDLSRGCNPDDIINMVLTAIKY